MERYEFKKHKIRKNCKKKYKRYPSYKKYLQKDFCGHCAYCNLNEEWVYPLPFEIDHFIPRAAFEAVERNDLDTDYRNLMYSCSLCNRLKGNLFGGKIRENEIYNPFFYNPVEIDYNKIFYRDAKGRIHSDDDLGRQMIIKLQLYRPTKQIAWFLDELQEVLQRVEGKIALENDVKKKEKLTRAKIAIEATLYKTHRLFVHSYRDEKK